MYSVTHPHVIMPGLLVLLCIYALLHKRKPAREGNQNPREQTAYGIVRDSLALPQNRLSSRREALESARVAWGLWHTGTRMRIEKLLKVESLKRILVLQPCADNPSLTIVADRSKERTESIANEILDITKDAICNKKDIRWYLQHRESSFTIYDSTPISEDGILKPCSDNAWIHVEYLIPKVGVDQRTGEAIYNKGKDKARFMGFYQEYEDVWERSVQPTTTKVEKPFDPEKVSDSAAVAKELSADETKHLMEFKGRLATGIAWYGASEPLMEQLCIKEIVQLTQRRQVSGPRSYDQSYWILTDLGKRVIVYLEKRQTAPDKEESQP